MTITIHWLLSVATFALVMLITPGPNNILMANSSATHGYKKTLPIIFGVVLGPMTVLILLALGGLVLLKLAVVRNSLRIACFIYVLYLAYKIAAAKPPDAKVDSKILSIWHVIALQWLNPKVWVQYIVVLSLYLNSQYHYTQHVMVIALIFLVLSFFTGSFWALLGKVIARYLKKSIHYKIFNIIMATLLLLAVLPELLEHFV